MRRVQTSAPSGRQRQLAYSTIQSRMADVEERRRKARKILAILEYHLGRRDLSGLVVLDVGCSLGFFTETALQHGAQAIGLDIDVPGVTTARRDRDPRCEFLSAEGEALPVRDGSIDVVVFNHIYEHAVDPDQVMREIRRVLRPEGLVYLGLGNRLGVIEPHYKLPFLSWLPQRLADRYVQAFGKAETYHERFRTLPGLRRMAAGLHVHDYSFTLVADPGLFEAGDVAGGAVPAVARALGRPGRWLARWLLPTYVWVASPSSRRPQGSGATLPPQEVETPAA
jgi:SAM-dependent methyltransferase